jgi:hypothetical protein
VLTLANLWIVVGILFSTSLPSRAPVPNDPKADAQQKAIKEFAGKVVVAIAKQDIDGLVEMSEVPWYRDAVNFSEDKKELRKDLEAMLDEKPVFEAKKYSVKRIETFKVAQTTLSESDIKGYKKALGDDDFVVHVEVDYPAQKIQVRLLVKLKDGKPRLVGFGQESR